MANGADRVQTKSLNSHRECSQRRLTPHLDLVHACHGLTERDFQNTIVSLSSHGPADDGRAALHFQNFSGPLQKDLHRFQFALKNLIVNQMILPQQSRSDLRFDLSRGGEEQLAFASLACGLPLHFGSTRSRKKSAPRFVVAQGCH